MSACGVSSADTFPGQIHSPLAPQTSENHNSMMLLPRYSWHLLFVSRVMPYSALLLCSVRYSSPVIASVPWRQAGYLPSAPAKASPALSLKRKRQGVWHGPLLRFRSCVKRDSCFRRSSCPKAPCVVHNVAYVATRCMTLYHLTIPLCSRDSVCSGDTSVSSLLMVPAAASMDSLGDSEVTSRVMIVKLFGNVDVESERG